MTKWQSVTHILVRIISFGVSHGRCDTCGSWLSTEMVAPSCSGTVCITCDTKRMIENINKINRVVK